MKLKFRGIRGAINRAEILIPVPSSKAGGLSRARTQQGLGLIEVLIAVAILAIIAVVFLSALATASKAIITADERTTAESLTRSELEYIKNVGYSEVLDGFSYEIPGDPPGWDPTHALYAHYDGYSLSMTGVPIGPDTHQPTEPDVGMQKITVTVYHQGKQILVTRDYKVDR